jgi:hypothetical protein
VDVQVENGRPFRLKMEHSGKPAQVVAVAHGKKGQQPDGRVLYGV